MNTCPGLFRSEIDGQPYCPRDADLAPPEWQSWEDFCSDCRANQVRWLELAGECARDERVSS